MAVDYPQMQKLGKEVRLEAMENCLQMEWSTKTFDILSQLFGAISRPRTWTNAQIMNQQVMNPHMAHAPGSISQPSEDVFGIDPATVEGVPDAVLFGGEEEEEGGAIGALALLHMSVKLDISNISVFICDSAGGEWWSL